MSLGLLLAAALSANWPVRYNAGVTAYHSNDFTTAATTFEQATASPDRALQQRAYYNLGNTCYRLGQAQPLQAQQLWQHAEKSYESALAIDPHDADAKFNYDFVKKKLEELEKQQQQQQQQDKQQQDKQQQDKKQKQDNQQQQQPEQKQPEQKQDQQQQQPQPKQHDKPNNQKQQDQPQQSPQPNNLDKQQAAALLDNLREEERNWNFFPEMQMKDLKDAGEPAKDW